MLRFTVLRVLSHPLGRLLLLAALVLLMPLTVKAGTLVLKTLHRPGPVSDTSTHDTPIKGYTSHAQFEKECSHCHAPLHCITANRCQECHLDIAQQRADAVGLHGVLPGTARCQTCHIEHRGRDAVISDVPLANIDHGELTGFSLALHPENYSGDALGCDDCHVNHKFAPESVDCIDCHAANEPDLIAGHRAEYGDGCLECHDGRDRMREFDHDLVYPLAGRHAEVACRECHTEQVYAGTVGDCAACHQEPELHAGEFGLQCDYCHSAAAWAPAQFRQHAFLTALGPDGDLPCQTCHVDSYTQYPCDSCHDRAEMRTVHQALSGAQIDDCVGCHPSGPGQVRVAAGTDGPLEQGARPAGQAKDGPGQVRNTDPQPARTPAASQGHDRPGNVDPGSVPQGGTDGAHN